MTGKGDRWGRDRLGRSAPAFLSANIFALPPPTCTARQEAGRHLQLLFLLQGRPSGPFVSLRPVPSGESAGCVRLQCLFSRLCACPPFACHTHCPHQRSCPHSSLLCPVQFCFVCPCSSMCARIITVCQKQQFASCKTVLLAAATRACSGGPCAGSLLTLTFFPAESMILGHGLV